MPKWEDGSPAQAKSEARAEQRASREREHERPVRERESLLGLRERPDPPDLLGIRLIGEKPGSSEQFGVTLMDPEQSDQLEKLKSDVDFMIDRFSRNEWRAERPERTPGSEPASGPSCTYTPILGLGPTVNTDSGNLGLDVPLSGSGLPSGWSDIKLGWSITPSASLTQNGMGGTDRSLGLDVSYGLPFKLAEVSIGGSYQYDRPGTSALEFGGTILGYTCRIGVEANQVTRQFDKATEEAAQGAAPYILDALRKLGLPAVP